MAEFRTILKDTMDIHERYQAHLDRVSRSFAFCIRQLPAPLFHWVSLSYLLCRVVDTIEDSGWASAQQQLEVFERFDRTLKESLNALPLIGWENEFPKNVSAEERLLLTDTHILIQDLHSLSPQVAGVIRELVLSMSSGMQHFCRQRQGGVLRLRNLAEVNQYCFFVAGLVGELLSKLLVMVEPGFILNQRNLLNAHHFGLFLQKVNLLKDQVDDERVGRHLIPSRSEVEDSAEADAEAALEFLIAVPKDQSEFRRFCGWSLFLGLEALHIARQSINENQVLKVPRAVTGEILESVDRILADDAELRAQFIVIRSKLGWSSRSEFDRESNSVPAWLTRLYQGPLLVPALCKLGL